MLDARWVRLGVDFGTTHTVAALGAPDGRAQPLLFDANPLLPSAVYAESSREAVYAEPGGEAVHAEPRGEREAGGGATILVGRDAERAARTDPSRFEPNPKRRIDDGSILLGSAELGVPELITAVLRRVAAEAARASGGEPPATVLTHPVSWGAARTGLLVRAAEAAGLPAVTLVPEPVAAAVYFTAVLRRPAPVGSALVVYDLGAGTFDTTVLRREVTGWSVVASDGLEVGGLDLDAALAAHLTRDQPAAARGPDGTDELALRRRRALFEEARAAKEQLSRSVSARVRLPGSEAAVHVTRDEFEAVALPVLERTVEVTAATLARARVPAPYLAGVFLVGGSSRIPLVGTLLHRRLGVAPVAIEQPELVVALGSVAAAGPQAMPAPPQIAPAAPVQANAPVPRRGKRSRLLLAAVLGLALVVCGAGGAAIVSKLDELRRDAGTTDDPTTGSNTGKPASGQRLPIGRTVWYGGMKVTFTEAAYQPDADFALTITGQLENLSPKSQYFFAPVVATVDGNAYEGRPNLSSAVPGGAKTNVTFQFRVDRALSRLAGMVLTVGENGKARPTVDLGDPARTEPLEPRRVLGKVKINALALTVTVAGCDLRADDPDDARQSDAALRILICDVDVHWRGAAGEPGGQNIATENFQLKLPDGTARSADDAPILLLRANQHRTGRLRFGIQWPAPGRYALQVLDLGFLNGEDPTPARTGEAAFTLS